MKKPIRINECELKHIIMESIDMMLNETSIDYWRNNYHKRLDDYTTDLTHDYSDRIPEEYIEFAKRLEKVTKSEWNIHPETENDNVNGKNSIPDGHTLTFTTTQIFNNRMEAAKCIDLIESMAKAFFDKNDYMFRPMMDCIDYECVSDRTKITLYVSSMYSPQAINKKRKYRNIQYGKSEAGKPMERGEFFDRRIKK